MTTKNIETKEFIDVKDYLGIEDSHDKLAYCLRQEERLNRVLETLDSMSERIDSIDKRTKEIMDREFIPVDASDIDHLFEDSGSADMNWIDEIA